MVKATATATKIYALEGLRGMTYDEMASAIRQLLSKSDCSAQIALLDIAEVYAAVDLQSEQARTLLFQKINR